MLTSIQVWQRLLAMGVNKSLSEVEAALSQVDQQAAFDTQRARIRIEVWDKTSPINGIPAEQVLSRTDIPAGGEIYLLYIDDRLVYLQPHDPDQAGLVPMTPDTVLTVANRHADAIATQYADDIVFASVLEKLLAT